MRNKQNLIGILFGLGFGGLAYVTASAVGALIYQRPQGTAAAVYPGPAIAAAPAAAEETAAVETAAAPAAGHDLAAGEKAFKACKACHKAEAGAKGGTGPNLWGVLGRPVASVDGFAYSEPMKALAGGVWDAAALDAFLADPKGSVKGTKMAFAGVKDAAARGALIGWLGQQSDSPADPGAVVTPVAAEGTEAPAEPEVPAEPYADLAEDAVVEIDPVPYPEGVTYADVPALSEAELAEIEARVAALEAELPALDYQRARYHPIHNSPQIETASSAECLVCHQEITRHEPRATSPAGVAAADSLAWYQTLDTYSGPQADFHWRHLQSDYAQQVMKLECTFCHKGNDPREESPDMMPTRAAFGAGESPEFTLRKMVNPSESCLMCHGAMPDPEGIMGLAGDWHAARVDLEYAEAPNGCLSCHAETFRTNRHQVNYLNAAAIEEIARSGTSDSCFGCHGGRAWYRISYPYARHPWPGMDDSTVPDWAADRPTASRPEHQLPAAQP